MQETIDFTPPMLNGVTASKVFLAETTQYFNTIFNYLCEQFPHITVTEWKQRFNEQLIFDLKGNVLTLESAFQANTHIYYYRFLAHEIFVPFQEKILFENI